MATRLHPETDALGIRAGGFLIFPKVTVDEGVNDNIYATNGGTVSDLVTVVNPQVMARSDWNNHSATVSASESHSVYAGHATENTDDYTIAGTGRLDIARDGTLSVNAGYSRLHEPRTSPDNTFGKTPTAYSLGSLGVRTYDKFNRLSIGFDTAAQKYEYTDVPTSVGDFIQQKDRDRWELSQAVRAGYEIVPEYEAFVRAAVDDRAYAHAVDSTGFRHSSVGGDIRAGLTIDLTGLTFGEIGVGYLTRRYDDPRFSPVQGPSALIGLTWNATPLITVRLDGARTVEEAVVVGASGMVRTAGSVTIDHELLRQLVLDARFGVAADQYRGITQHQVTLTGDFAATYRFDHNVYGTVKFTRTSCDSSNQINTFTQNIAIVRVSLQL